jgi:hypothetical protein
MTEKTSKAQLEASARYFENNKEAKRRQNSKSQAKRFVREYAEESEMLELNNIFKSRKP